jgi:glycerophosphoryl diester phosphodiesterase
VLVARLMTAMSRATPIAFAHRGASGYLPENTLPAFRLALEQRADGIESDVWLSRDGVPVLVHDQLLRSDGRRRRVRVTDLRRAELQAHDIPALSDLYAACGNAFELSLDLESPDVTEAVLHVAGEHAATSRLWACHDDLDLLRQLRARSADVHTVCSTHLEPLRLDALLPALVGAGVDALNLRWSGWNRPLVDAVHASGLLAFGWDAHTARRVARLLQLGVDAIYSDFPDQLVDQVRRFAEVGSA